MASTATLLVQSGYVSEAPLYKKYEGFGYTRMARIVLDDVTCAPRPANLILASEIWAQTFAAYGCPSVNLSVCLNIWSRWCLL